MKVKQALLILFLFLFTCIEAQDVGRVIIRNASESFPKFIVSMNGIRLSNDYSSSVTFNYLDEYSYKINILQAGSRNTLSFMVYSAPNYVSTYVISKDNYGNYLFNLEKKEMMGDSSGLGLKTMVITTPTPIGEPVAPVAAKTKKIVPVNAAESEKPGPIIDEGDYFDIVKTLKKETLEKNRLEMAKTFFADKWLLASMVRDAIKMFNLEASRVDFAKFAYFRCVDKQNYYKVFDGFTLSKSKKDMNEFIKTNP